MLFGKIGRTASEEVVIELNKSKRVPCFNLMYPFDACYLTKSQLNSLDFAGPKIVRFPTQNVQQEIASV